MHSAIPNFAKSSLLGLGKHNAETLTNAAANQVDAPSVASDQRTASSAPTSNDAGQPRAITFAPDEVELLRNQLSAYKLLAKNAPLTRELQLSIFKNHRNRQSITKSQAVEAASEIIKNEKAGSPAASQKTQQPAPGKATDAKGQSANDDQIKIHTYELNYNPRGYIQKMISSADHRNRRNRKQIPSLLPIGVDVNTLRAKRENMIASLIAARKRDLLHDPIMATVDDDRIQEERERIAYNRIQARKGELENLPANLAQWDTSKSDTPTYNDAVKRKALIEYKMLCLLPKQRALRLKVHRDVLHFDNLAQTANRSMYRRQKKNVFRDARVAEKVEKDQKDARENTEKKKQLQHIEALMEHGSEMRKAAEAQRAKVQKLGRLMITQHQTIEKEEQKRIERTAKQRLQALKNDDEETYLKLLGQAKDSRISHLLKQTDGFLNQLAESVKAQQGAARQHQDENQDVDDSDDDESGGAKVDYYEVAHRIKEEVKLQPTILVGGTLKEYQLKGLQWMISLFNNNLNGILADEMGLGKTIQTISLVTYLIEHKKQKGPFLVIVPLSTLTNWNLEFDKWAPTVNKIVYKGPPPARKMQQAQLRNTPFQVVLTTYEYIIKDRPILSRIKWLHMIVDEGHRMKNAQSKLSSTLTQYYTTRYRLILTGTPLQNNLPELWALLNFVLPNIFKSVKSFDEWFNTPFANTGGQDKMELSEEEQLLVIRRLHKVLRPFLLRRLKKDVEKDLPDKQEKVIKCRFSALQAKVYKQLMTKNRIDVSDGKGGKAGIRGLSNMLMQLRKVCNHPFVFEQVEDLINPSRLTNDLLWRTAGKFELLDRILPKIQATGHKVLMFFQMTQIMNIMEDFFRLRGLTYLRLDGSTKSDERSELLAQFNAPDSNIFCFLLSTRAGGLGLNLQTADTVIIYDSDWNPHQDLQAQDRAHRIGQKNEVRILRLISSNSVEEKILEKAQYKLDMDGKVIQAGKFDNKSTAEERDALLRTLLDSAEAAEEMATQEEIDDEELNLIISRNETELAKFVEMDAIRNADPVYGLNGTTSRLVSESELPEIYLNEDDPAAEEIDEIAGRGARERTRVKYDDGLTEEQWLMAVDDDEDTIEAAVARKEALIGKRNANKAKREKKAQGLESSPEPSPDSSVAPSNKKRSRKSAGTKRKADEEMIEDEPVSKKKRPTKSSKPVESLTPAQRATLQEILDKNYQHLDDLEEVIPDEPLDEKGEPTTRGLIEPFIKLVPRKGFEDYYVIIKEPICMEMIEKKINKKEYQNLREYREDISLLCQNARTYNEDDSLLYQDANKIEVSLSLQQSKCLRPSSIFVTLS